MWFQKTNVVSKNQCGFKKPMWFQKANVVSEVITLSNVF